MPCPLLLRLQPVGLLQPLSLQQWLVAFHFSLQTLLCHLWTQQVQKQEAFLLLQQQRQEEQPGALPQVWRRSSCSPLKQQQVWYTRVSLWLLQHWVITCSPGAPPTSLPQQQWAAGCLVVSPGAALLPGELTVDQMDIPARNCPQLSHTQGPCQFLAKHLQQCLILPPCCLSTLSTQCLLDTLLGRVLCCKSPLGRLSRSHQQRPA